MRKNRYTTIKIFFFTLILSCPFGGFSQIVEDFETGVAWPWAPWQVETAGGNKVTTPVHNGTYSIENPDWHYRTDVTYGNTGDDISMWVYFDAAGTGRTYWGFGASAAGCHSLVVANNTSELILQENNGYGYTDIAQIPFTYQGSQWYRAELIWNSATNVTANLYDSDGTTLLTNFSATLPNLVPGGFALRSFGGAYMDDLGRNCGSGTTPTVTANGSTNICAGDQVQLESDVTSNIEWNTGATTPTINVGTAGNYYVTTQDACGISGNLTSNTVTVNVNANPTVNANVNPSTSVCPNESITLYGSGTATNYSWDNGVTDGIGFNIPTTTTYEVTGTDGNGCSSTDQITITAEDNQAPVPSIASLPDITEECEVTSLSAPTANDNCDGTINGTHNASLPITSNTTVTWTYTDAQGNNATQSQNVIIDDVSAPIADVANLPNITDECEVTSLTAPTATDNCDGILTGTHNASLPISTTTTVTWTYTDIDGNSSSQTQDVIIDDVTAPVADITTLPDLTDECEITALTAPTATDNCDGILTGTHNASLPISTTTTVTWTYTDVAGNTTSQTQEVIIDDVTAPVADITTLPDLTDECEITALTAPTATDNCDGILTGTHNASLPISTTTTVTWTYTDIDGNTSSQTQEVIIDDVTDPVADSSSLNDLQDICEITSLDAPTATDNCDGSITATHNETLPITDSTVITWTFTDATGNTSTQTQNVFITGVNTNTSINEITITAENNNSGVTYQWYNCIKGDTISGATDSTFTATTNGEYAVIVTEGDCVDTSECVAITTVGIAVSSKISKLRIYPNPTNGQITILGLNDQVIKVYDARGRMVMNIRIKAEKTELDLSHLKKGVYYFHSKEQIFKVIRN